MTSPTRFARLAESGLLLGGVGVLVGHAEPDIQYAIAALMISGALVLFAAEWRESSRLQRERSQLLVDYRRGQGLTFGDVETLVWIAEMDVRYGEFPRQTADIKVGDDPELTMLRMHAEVVEARLQWMHSKLRQESIAVPKDQGRPWPDSHTPPD